MPFLTDPRFIKLMRVVFAATCLFALVMALLPQPPYVPTQNLGDKVNHIIGFSVLAAFAALAFPEAPRWRVIERLSFFGAFIEVAQSIPSLGRDCEILDFVADTVAVMVVTGIAALLARRGRGRRRRR